MLKPKIRISLLSSITARILKKNRLASVCEEAMCPNMNHCFANQHATFMIMGSRCSRSCSFCNVICATPTVIDLYEIKRITQGVIDLKLKHVVITSPTRDDLKDGGASHFSACIRAIRKINSEIKIEILTPDFIRCQREALEILSLTPPDIFGHNLETVERLYSKISPGKNYKNSLDLLANFKKIHPSIPTKSSLILGMGEEWQEIIKTLIDLRENMVDMIVLGQYLKAKRSRQPVIRYLKVSEFDALKEIAKNLGFKSIVSFPLARASYPSNAKV